MCGRIVRVAFFSTLAVALGVRDGVAQVTSLFSFANRNGSSPNSLLQTSGGNFLGTTYGGGLNDSACSQLGCGVIFRFSSIGGLKVLHRFQGKQDGSNPATGLVRAARGGYYGTTYYAGGGTVFSFDQSGLQTLHVFGSAAGEGTQPNGLIQASDGNLYGTTASGPGSGFGTISRLTPEGALSTLKTYPGKHPSVGIIPQGLMEAIDHNFYGVVGQGGNATDLGSVFQLTPGGQYKTLHTFHRRDGGILMAGLIQANDGNLYGVTSAGGDLTHCKSSLVSGCGTVFRIGSSGEFQVLHQFQYSDGASPYAALLQAADGYLYGSTSDGGPVSPCPGSIKGVACGTIFRIALDGTFSTVYVFNGHDGANPGAQLIQGSDGKLYGTTARGGKHGAGTIFQLTPPAQ